MQKKKAGFSLMELLIAVGIMAMLATVAVPNFSSSADAAKTAKIQADVQTIGTAAMMYYTDTGSYPATVDALATGNKYLQAVPEAPGGSSYAINSSTGEVTCTYKGMVYSSFGKKTAAVGG